MKSHEVIKETVEKLGAKKVAGELGVSLSLLYKWSEPESESGAANPVQRVADLCKACDDVRPIAWLCQQMDGVYVKNSAAADERVDVLQQTQKLVTAFSEMLSAVSRGWEDGELTVDEAAKIRADGDSLKSVAETFVVGCEKHAAKTKRK
jgi:hypothetical protein